MDVFFLCLVMKKIEITIGCFPLRRVFFVNIDIILEKIPGLESLVEKISESISGKFLSNTFFLYPCVSFT